MAIRLASAIGQQREPIGILGGVDDAINKTGDAIQADLDRKAEAAAKKKDQEQKYKDAIAASVSVDPLDKAFPEEKKEYEVYLTNGMADIAVAAADPNVTPAQLKKKKDDFEYGARDRKNVYSRAYDAFGGVAKKEEEGAYDTALFKNWFLGKENTQVADMPNDDFMAASEKDRAGKLVGENGMQATETKITSQTVPYLNKSFEEKKNIDFATKADELVSLKRPDTLAASRGYYGKPFEFEAYTVRTDKVSPTTGEYIFNFDEAQVDLDAKKFASSVIGEGNFGSKEHAQYQRALQNEALVAGNEAGFSGDRLAAFVQETVPKMAYDDFVLNARSAYDKRIKNDKDITKAPSRGTVINNGNGMFSNGNTSMNKTEEITPYIQRKYAAKESQIKTNIEKLKNSTNPTDQQTVKGYEKSLSDLERLKASEAKDHIKYSNSKAKDDQYVTYGIVSGKDKDGKDIKENISFRPEDFFEKNGKWYMAGEEKKEELDDDGKNVVTYLDRELPLDENNYKKLITEDRLVIPLLEKHGIKASGVNQSAAPSKEAAKDDGYRPDGTKKGKGYFGELKMEDGSGKVASEISMNFDDVIGGALIPSLVPTLTESEKKYLLKGNKPTKEIQLKAIKHAEDRASKGLSPFADGGELKSKSGKPIYWDKTAKTYKYK